LLKNILTDGMRVHEKKADAKELQFSLSGLREEIYNKYFRGNRKDRDAVCYQGC
jgi:hypothetical protein